MLSGVGLIEIDRVYIFLYMGIKREEVQCSHYLEFLLKGVCSVFGWVTTLNMAYLCRELLVAAVLPTWGGLPDGVVCDLASCTALWDQVAPVCDRFLC